MKDLHEAIENVILTRLDESAKLTNGDVNKIMKELKKEIAKTRKSKSPLAEDDAIYLEFFMDAFRSRNLKKIYDEFERGETENREQKFAIVSKVIGKERATDLYQGKF